MLNDIAEKIIIKKRAKKDVYADMDYYELPHELAKTPMINITLEEIQKAYDDIVKEQANYEALNAMTPGDIWKQDLLELEDAYWKKLFRIISLKYKLV